MNLRHLTDNELRESSRTAVAHERQALYVALHHLLEVERRRLFSADRLKSLFEYAVKIMGYSETEAYARIDAMHLMKELPEIEKCIEDGRLNLTKIKLAQNLFRREKREHCALEKHEKLELLAEFEEKTTREVAKYVATIAPEALIPDSIRPVTETLNEYRFVGPDRLEEKIQRAKGRLAHSHPGMTMAELFEYLLDREEIRELKARRTFSVARKKSRVITRGIKDRLEERYRRKCANCGSYYALEQDHITPFGKGGETSVENLQTLCRNCNQRKAIEQYGLEKMDRYLNPER